MLTFCWWFSEESACNAGDLGPTLVSGRPLEEDMVTHSSLLARRIPWTEEPGGFMGSQRVGQLEWLTLPLSTFMLTRWLPSWLQPHIVFPVIYCNLRNQCLSTKYLKVQKASLLRWRINWRGKGSWGKVARVWGVRWGREASGWSPVQFHGLDFGSDPPGQLCGQVTSLKCLKLWLGARIHPSDSGYFSQISALQCPCKVSSDNLRSFWRHRGWLFPNEVEHVRALCLNNSSNRR